MLEKTDNKNLNKEMHDIKAIAITKPLSGPSLLYKEGGGLTLPKIPRKDEMEKLLTGRESLVRS